MAYGWLDDVGGTAELAARQRRQYARSGSPSSTVMAADAGWVAGSIVVIVLPGLGITITGTLLIAVVEEIVGGFAVVKAVALRRKRRFGHAAATG